MKYICLAKQYHICSSSTLYASNNTVMVTILPTKYLGETDMQEILLALSKTLESRSYLHLHTLSGFLDHNNLENWDGQLRWCWHTISTSLIFAMLLKSEHWNIKYKITSNYRTRPPIIAIDKYKNKIYGDSVFMISVSQGKMQLKALNTIVNKLNHTQGTLPCNILSLCA